MNIRYLDPWGDRSGTMSLKVSLQPDENRLAGNLFLLQDRRVNKKCTKNSIFQLLWT